MKAEETVMLGYTWNDELHQFTMDVNQIQNLEHESNYAEVSYKVKFILLSTEGTATITSAPNNLTTLDLDVLFATIGDFRIYGYDYVYHWASLQELSNIPGVDYGTYFSNLQTIKLGRSLQKIPNYFTRNCKYLTSIQINSDNTTFTDGDCNAIIRISNNHLIAGCKTTIIPSTVVAIETEAFANQGRNGALTIPSSVTTIGENAFQGNSITSLTVSWTGTLASVTNNNAGFDCAHCVLHVPAGTYETYKNHPYWGKFDKSQGGAGIVEDFGNILFIGHSATAHPYNGAYWPMGGQPKPRDGVADCIQGDECRGMAATTMNTDYVGTVLRGMYGKTREELQSNHYGYFDLVTARWAQVGGNFESNLHFFRNGQTWDTFVGNCLAQNGVQGALPSQASVAQGQAKTVVVSLGENIKSTSTDDIYATFMHIYGHFAKHRPDVNIIQLILDNKNTPTDKGATITEVIKVAAEQFKYDWARSEWDMSDINFTGTITTLDCTNEAFVGKFIGDEYVLKDDGTSFYQLTNDELHSGVLWHPSDIGLYYVGKKVLEEIYKNDATKKAQALANIGDIYKINYIGNNKAVKMYSTYADNTAWEQYLNQTYGNWVQDGLVNMRVDFANYSAFKPYFKRFKASKVSDGSELTILKEDWKNSNTWAQVVFKATKGDMNFEPIFEVALGDGGSDNQTKISLFAGKANPDVTLTRNTKAGVWNTICLPFKPTAAQLKQMFGDGVEIQAFTGVRKGTSGIDLVFAAIDLNNFQAGVPYIVKPTSETLKTGVTLENVTFAAATAGSVTHSYDGDNYTFKGIYDPFAVTGEDQKESNILFLSEGGLSYPKNNGNINAFRCYFQISGQTVNLSRMNVVFGGETNAISSMPMSQEKQEMNMDRIFTIDGRFVGHSLKGLKKGLYIQNGKKIVID